MRKWLKRLMLTLLKWTKKCWNDVNLEFPGSKIKRSLIFTLVLFVVLFFMGKRMVMFFIKIICYYWIKKRKEKERVENKLSRMGIK